MWLMTTIGFFSVVQKPGTDFFTVSVYSMALYEAVRTGTLGQAARRIESLSQG